MIERVYQAACTLPEERADRYFGTDGFAALRGMRNRLAHNYLGIDDQILFESVESDLPAVQRRLASDAAEALRVAQRASGQIESLAEWREQHLGSTD